MSEVQHTMTGLEARFEEELSTLPGWRLSREEFRDAPPADVETRPESDRDRAVEAAMILGR